MAIIIESDLRDPYESFKKRAASLEGRLQNDHDTMAAGDIDADFIRALTIYINNAMTYIDNFLLIPGIVQFVKDYENDQTYDISVEATSLKALLQAVIDEIKVRFPVSGTYLLYAEWVGNVIQPRTLTPANTSTIRTVINAVTAFIGT